MPATAKVSRKFYETFGDEIANELVQWVAKVKAGLRSGLAEQRAEPVGLAIAVRWLALRCLFCDLRRVCGLSRVLPIPLFGSQHVHRTHPPRSPGREYGRNDPAE